MKTAFGPKQPKSFRDNYLALALVVMALFIGSVASAQNNNLTKYTNYRYLYGNKTARLNADTVLMTPADTIFSKDGLARLGTTLWIGNHVYWTQVGFSSTDTIIKLPPGHNGNGNPGGIRFNDTLYVFQVSKDTIWVTVLLEATNGLTKSLDTVVWGGPLNRETDIDQNSNGITFHDGLFIHGTGNYTGQTTTYSLLRSGSDFFEVKHSDGANKFASISEQGTNTDPLVYLQAAKTAFVASELQIKGSEIRFNQTGHNYFIENLKDSAQSYTLQYNPTNSKITYYASSGGGGGSLSITADRGLHTSSPSNVRWGGSLDSIVDIDQAGNGIVFHDGLFQHGTGDYINQVSDYSILEFNSNFFNSYQQVGPKFTNINHQTGTTTWVDLEAGNATTQSVIRLTPELISIGNTNGNLVVSNLIDSAQAYSLHYNPTNGKVTYSALGGGGGISGITADGGLTASSSTNVRLGGTLDAGAVDIDQAGNGITFHDGIFTHNNGDYTGFASPWGILSSDNNAFHVETGTDATTFAGLTLTGSIITFESEDAAGDSRFDFGNNQVSLHNVNGNFFIPNLIDSSQAYTLHYNPSTSKVTYALNSGGGGGGGGGSGLSQNALNGLTMRNDSTVVLGGTLDQTTTINSATFGIGITGSVATNSLSVTNTHASGGAINATAGTSGAALTGTGGLYGVYGSTTGGTAIRGVSTTGIGMDIISNALAAKISINPATTNTSDEVMQIIRSTSGTAADGIGGIISLQAETVNGTQQTAAQLRWKWTTAATATRKSLFELWGTNNATQGRILAVAGDGQVTNDSYGIGTHAGTPTKMAGWDGSGNLIEVDPVTGGGGAVSTNSTLTGDGLSTPLGVNTSTIATLAYVDGLQIQGGTTLTGWTNILTLAGTASNGSYTSGTDNAPAVNSWLGGAASGSTLFIPRGSFKFNSSVTIPSGKLIFVVVEGDCYFGTNDGFIIDGFEQIFISKGHIYGTNQTGTINYGSQTNAGVYVRNCTNCRIELNEVMGFKYGVKMGGYATGTALVKGAQFNNLKFNYLRRNSVGIYLHPDGGTTNSNGNWVNANFFEGGEITADTAIAFRPDVTQGDRMNGNVFKNIGMENGGSTTIPMKCAIYLTFAVNNSFIGCRFEPVPITKKLVCTTDVDNTSFIAQSYFDWQWLDAPGNNILITGPIYDGVSGISIGNMAQGYRFSSTSTFYNGRVKVFGTTRSPSAVLNIPANIDVQFTNETSTLQTGATYTVLPGIDLVRVNYTGGTSTITLPAATSNPDRIIIVKNLHATNAVAVVGQSNISGSGVAQYKSAGGSWIKIN